MDLKPGDFRLMLASLAAMWLVCLNADVAKLSLEGKVDTRRRCTL